MATQQSSKLLLYHATSYEFLLEVSIAQAVAQKLQCELSHPDIMFNLTIILASSSNCNYSLYLIIKYDSPRQIYLLLKYSICSLEP